ncbi:MAG TPA: transposase, partial [Acidimicrobiia bacterium]
SELMNEYGVGPAVAASLLITFGTNPDRIGSDAAFAALCGVSAVDASSGLQQRHRLNRGGDRQANHALWRIVTVRLAHHQPTRNYLARRISEGKTKRETIRVLKRHIARRIWRILNNHPPPLDKP